MIQDKQTRIGMRLSISPWHTSTFHDVKQLPNMILAWKPLFQELDK